MLNTHDKGKKNSGAVMDTGHTMVAGRMGYAARPPFIVELRALCGTIKIAD